MKCPLISRTTVPGAWRPLPKARPHRSFASMRPATKSWFVCNMSWFTPGATCGKGGRQRRGGAALKSNLSQDTGFLQIPGCAAKLREAHFFGLSEVCWKNIRVGPCSPLLDGRLGERKVPTVAHISKISGFGITCHRVSNSLCWNMSAESVSWKSPLPCSEERADMLVGCVD